MHFARRYLASLILTAGFVVPTAIIAAPRPQSVGVQVRVYDKKHKDYHNWDDHENHQWGMYLSENHKRSHEYAKASNREQQQYWNWRHRHSD